MSNPKPVKSGVSLPMLGSKLYGALKWVTVVGLPAANSLYFGLAQLWGWHDVSQVLGTSALVATFLGIVLGLSAISYNASDSKYSGEVHVATDAGGAVLKGLILNGDADAVAAKKALMLKVQNVESGTPPEQTPATSDSAASTSASPAASEAPQNPSSASQ